jgi:hypothetical protein
LGRAALSCQLAHRSEKLCDRPGLTAQADSFDAFADSVFALAPELLRATGAPAGTPIRVTIIAERRATTLVTA